MTREEREAAIKYFELLNFDCVEYECESCRYVKDCKAYTILDANKFAKLAIEALKQPALSVSCFYEPQNNGGCLGLQNGDDDEPIDRCKACPLHYINIEEREEIVRCEECKYDNNPCNGMVLFGDEWGEDVYKMIDYCSYGEKRTE